MAAVAVHRALVSSRGISARAARTLRLAQDRREGDADAHDAPPRQLGRLPRIRRALQRAAHCRAPAATRRARRGGRLRGGRRAPRSAAAERPRTRPELLAALGRPKLQIEDRRPWLVWYGLAAHAGLVNGPSSSTWRAHTPAARSSRRGRGSAPRCPRGHGCRTPRSSLPRRARPGESPRHRGGAARRSASSTPVSSVSDCAAPGRAWPRLVDLPRAPLPPAARRSRRDSSRAGTACCSPTTFAPAPPGGVP